MLTAWRVYIGTHRCAVLVSRQTTRARHRHGEAVHVGTSKRPDHGREGLQKRISSTVLGFSTCELLHKSYQLSWLVRSRASFLGEQLVDHKLPVSHDAPTSNLDLKVFLVSIVWALQLIKRAFNNQCRRLNLEICATVNRRSSSTLLIRQNMSIQVGMFVWIVSAISSVAARELEGDRKVTGR